MSELEKLKNSKTFCILPWIHLHVMPDSTVLPCCISPYDDHYGNGKTQTLNDIWNSDKFKKLRLDMLNDVPVAGCNRCYLLEASGFQSMRQSLNQRFEKYIDIANETKEDGSLYKLEIKYIDIRFSNLCNFKCRGCSPSLSSSWYEDHQALYQFKSGESKLKNIAINSPNFWKELEALIPYAEEIYFGGGEPLITKEHFEIIKKLDSLGLHKINLCYNTNLSQLNYGDVDLAELWSRFDMVSLGVSIDDQGKRAEYFRHGTRWAVIEKNLMKLRDEYKKIHLQVNCTVNLMNVNYLPELFYFLTENKIIMPQDFNINLLLDPVELTVQVLPAELKKSIKEKLLKFISEISENGPSYEKTVKDFEKIINFMEEKDCSYNIPLFKKNTKSLDSIRGESFEEVFPELKSLVL